MSTVRRLFSNSPQETERLAREFAASMKPGDWMGLTGPLGAGKSVWARGIGRGLGVTGNIASPTFTLVNIYHGRVRFCHVDLYRVNTAEELIDLGLETFDDKNTVVVVEWADNVPEFRPVFRWAAGFDRSIGNHRIITIEEIANAKSTVR